MGKIKAASVLFDDADADGDDSKLDYDDEYDSEYDSEYLSDGDQCQSCDKKAGGKVSTALTDEHLLLCGATLKGYSLKNKKWCM